MPGQSRLTGYQRVRLTLEWIKRGKEGDREAFIKKVCKLKGIEYTLPIKPTRSRPR